MSTSPSVKPGFRVFVCTKDDKSLIKLSVRKPTRKELEYADLEFSAKFNQCVCNNIPTQAKLLETLRENGTIDKKTEAVIAQLATDIRALEKQVSRDKFATPEAKAEALKQLDDLQDKLATKNTVIDSYFEHIAETKAQNAQRNFLVACVVGVEEGDRKGKRLWASVDDLLDEDDQSIINRVVYEYVMTTKDLPSKWDEMIAEQERLAKEVEAEDKAADEKKGEGEQTITLTEADANPAALDPATSEPEAAGVVIASGEVTLGEPGTPAAEAA